MTYFFVVILAGTILIKLLTLYTDYLWMASVGQAAVFTRILGTKVLLGVIVGLLFFVWLWINIRIARRPLPADITIIGKRLLPEEERAQIEQYAGRALLIFALAGGALAGLYASGRWLEYLQFTHAVDFGSTDPLLGRDVGFYVFRLNFIQYLWRLCFYAVGIAFVISVLVHLYQEAIRMVGNTIHALPRARRHCLGLLALALFLKIYGYRLIQFNLLYSQRGEFFSGASFADAHAKFPVLYLMMVLVAIVGIIMLVSIPRRDFKLAGWALAILLAVSFLGGSAYPNLIQRLVVLPTQLEKEYEYAQHNIQMTNQAYGLDQVKESLFAAQDNIDAQVIQDNPQTIRNIRLWDHRPLETVYDQLEALRAYYNFADVDVDRYWLNGEYRQVMLSARQLDYAKLPPPITWVNQYLTYTHGYGVCMSPVDEIGKAGLPIKWIEGLPPRSVFGELEVTRPAIYYMAAIRPRLIEAISPPEVLPAPPVATGPQAEPGAGPPTGPAAAAGIPQPKATKFAIVNTRKKEFDYPRTGGGAEGNVMTQYQGRGGVPLSGWFTRLAFAARFMDVQILLTEYIQPGSKILINRYLPDRLMAIAPFLVFDPDPYLTVIEGQLKWICDSYTFSRMYPYSTRQPQYINLNYIRNSVKIACDAYDGLPIFYVVDPNDPLVQCYQKIFPTLFAPASQMPEQTRAHLRYPQLLFIIQAQTFADYHMRDPETFFQREDSWAIPPEVYREGTRMMEAYYVVMKLPGEDKEEFLLMLPFVLRGREDWVMVAWMAARCDPPHYGELIVYKFPKGTRTFGPMQMESRIRAVPEISEEFTLWGSVGSRVIQGNLLIIPINDSLLYVEPVYVEVAEAQRAIPALHRVIVAAGDRIVMEPTLDAALSKLFGRVVEPAVKPTRPTPATEAPTAPLPPELRQVKELIQRALDLEAEAMALLRAGDLAGYQAKQQEQKKILEQLNATVR